MEDSLKTTVWKLEDQEREIEYVIHDLDGEFRGGFDTPMRVWIKLGGLCRKR